MTALTRRHARYDVRTDCMVTTAAGRLVGTRTLDASWDGLHVAACHEARIGERVHVALRVPRSSFWLEASGKVTRVSAGLREDDEAPSLGITLDGMHGMDRTVLGATLRRHRRLRPGRAGARDYARAVLRIAAP